MPRAVLDYEIEEWLHAVTGVRVNFDMEDAVRKGVSKMHTLSFTTHALVARLQTYMDPSQMRPNLKVMYHS